MYSITLKSKKICVCRFHLLIPLLFSFFLPKKYFCVFFSELVLSKKQRNEKKKKIRKCFKWCISQWMKMHKKIKWKLKMKSKIRRFFFTSLNVWKSKNQTFILMYKSFYLFLRVKIFMRKKMKWELNEGIGRIFVRPWLQLKFI